MDLRYPRWRDDAVTFLESDDCAALCELLGWDVDALRAKLAEGGRLRGGRGR